jgi:ADP-ribosylglycohydrolase
MALSIVETLQTFGRIEQDALVKTFARRFTEELYRGYARGTMSLLRQVAGGGDWRQIAPYLFGSGSYGNGAAMRVAPVGGFFSDNLDRAVEEARLSAEVTHAHPEGQAGAIAVAVAAALAAMSVHPVGQEFLAAVLPFVPESITRQRLDHALTIPSDQLGQAMHELGTGNEVSAQDTVPFCLWSAAYHLDSFEEALWWTAQGWGDCDTTCAIVGGIVALAVQEVPAAWVQRREPLPDLSGGIGWTKYP